MVKKQAVYVIRSAEAQRFGLRGFSSQEEADASTAKFYEAATRYARRHKKENAMRTPTTDEGLRLYDDLPPMAAALAAWTNPGPKPPHHAQAQRIVREAMPLLARALDRAARDSHASPTAGSDTEVK